MTDTLARDAKALRDRLNALPFGELPDLDTLEWMAAIHERLTQGEGEERGPVPQAKKMNYDWGVAQDYITAALIYRKAVSRMKALAGRETEPLLPEEKNYEPKHDPFLRVADARWKVADFARECAAKRKTDLRRLWKDVIEPVQEHFYALTRPGPSGLQSVVATPLEGTPEPKANPVATPAPTAASEEPASEESGAKEPGDAEPAGKESGMRKVA